MDKEQKPDKCPWHRPQTLGYVQAQLDAERRHFLEELQVQCPDCKYWFWPGEYAEDKELKK